MSGYALSVIHALNVKGGSVSAQRSMDGLEQTQPELSPASECGAEHRDTVDADDNSLPSKAASLSHLRAFESYHARLTEMWAEVAKLWAMQGGAVGLDNHRPARNVRISPHSDQARNRLMTTVASGLAFDTSGDLSRT
jgi:hypothetical protein